MIYRCCDTSRRAVLANQTVYNGIDYLEVDDGPVVPQSVLYVHFLHPLMPGQLQTDNISICGGERIQNIQVLSVVEGGTLESPPLDPVCSLDSPPNGSQLLIVTVAQPGDFSTYTLSLVANTGGSVGGSASEPPPYFDPIYSKVDFSFKVGCPSWFDCQQTPVCPPEITPVPSFSYLARDYASLRALMLDRLSTLLPAWQGRNPADLGIVMVELLAYLGDYLSYQQDVLATEAYLGTARRRTSVRRHVKLVDYTLMDGQNARTWIHIEVNADCVLNQTTFSGNPQRVFTQGSVPGPVTPFPSDGYNRAIQENPQIFELMESAQLFAAHNQINFYTWGDRQCCLPAGATHAWLLGSYPNLAAGMVLIFVEAKGPETGFAEDADPAHRCAVRLSSVTANEDPIGNLFSTPPTTDPLPLTRIEWLAADALPFPLCISSQTPATAQGTPVVDIDQVSIALGNNALADSGKTILNEIMPSVPAANPALVPVAAGNTGSCTTPALQPVKPVRYSPQLQYGPLTFADPYLPFDSNHLPVAATSALQSRNTSELLPSITLTLAGDTNDIWRPQADLLHSDAEAKEFVAEVEDDGTATLRFGDGTFGFAVAPGDIFTARYRVGGGTISNVGTNSLCILASDDPVLVSNVITSVTNPLAAVGGLDPQSLDSVRQSAPYAFNTQERAVTMADYGAKALVVDPTLQNAQGMLRWTGSWYTVFIAVDPEGTETIDQTRKTQIINGMELYRMAGHDVDVDAPIYVSLELALEVCPLPGYRASDLQQELLQILSNHTLPDGTTGVFDPDNYTFGQSVYLSPIVAAVQNTAGVRSVTVMTFQRQGQASTSALSTGVITLQSSEIARLDNDPNFPEHGLLTVNVCGGD